MTTENSAPRFAYVSAICFSFALTAIIIVYFLAIGPSPSTTYVVPPLASGLPAMLFSFKWPQGFWRWGIVLSCGFWAFFAVVFLSYLSVGQLDWLSAIRTLSVLLAGMAGAVVGTYLRSSSRHH